MTLNLKFLFQYLEKEKVSIDQSEFEFQVQSHPNYPSLLSISDSLTFFNIDNGAIRIEFSDLELLPTRFVTLLKKSTDINGYLCFVEKKDSKFLITEDTQKVELTFEDLKTKWAGIVLLIEKSKIEIVTINTNKFYWILPILLFITFILVLIKMESNLVSNLFLIFPILGLLFSIAALKDLFGAKSELISNFCKISATTSCESIIGSDKWKIFSYINFSDLAVVFFSTQFIGLFLFLISGKSSDYFAIQSILIFGSIPVMLLSLYFQKFVE